MIPLEILHLHEINTFTEIFIFKSTKYNTKFCILESTYILWSFVLYHISYMIASNKLLKARDSQLSYKRRIVKLVDGSPCILLASLTSIECGQWTCVRPLGDGPQLPLDDRYTCARPRRREQQSFILKNLYNRPNTELHAIINKEVSDFLYSPESLPQPQA